MEPIVLIVGETSRLLYALDLLHQLNVPIYGIVSSHSLDTPFPTEPFDIPTIGSLKEKQTVSFLKKEDFQYFILEEEPQKRKDLYLKMKKLIQKEPTNLIHPNVSLSSHIEMGRGNLIGPYVSIRGGTIMNGLTWIGEGSIIETEVYLGNYVTIEAGVKIGRKVIIEEGVYIGHGAILYPEITIGKEARIGPGSVVLQSIAPKTNFSSILQ